MAFKRHEVRPVVVGRVASREPAQDFPPPGWRRRAPSVALGGPSQDDPCPAGQQGHVPEAALRRAAAFREKGEAAVLAVVVRGLREGAGHPPRHRVVEESGAHAGVDGHAIPGPDALRDVLEARPHLAAPQRQVRDKQKAGEGGEHEEPEPPAVPASPDRFHSGDGQKQQDDRDLVEHQAHVERIQPQDGDDDMQRRRQKDERQQRPGTASDAHHQPAKGGQGHAKRHRMEAEGEQEQVPRLA